MTPASATTGVVVPVAAPPLRGAAGKLSVPPNLLGALLGFGLIGGALLAVGRHDYPNLHAILDTGNFLLSAVLVPLLWDMSARTDDRFPKWLAVSFAATAVLHFVHVVVTLDWSGTLAPIAQAADTLRPATWPPATHVLPIGVAYAIWLKRRDAQRTLGLALGLIAAGLALLAAFSVLPRYSAPSWLGVTRPVLLLVPLLWAAVGIASWRLRELDRLLSQVASMAAILCLAHIAMLYSRAPHDTPAMVAHLGTTTGYLVLLLSLMQIASRDMQARIQAEHELALLNQELETRVRDRTERLDASNQTLAAEVALRKEVEDELRRSNEELELFAYVASHDLQEPLRMVTGYVQLLNKRYKGKLDSDADEFIAFALDGATRMQSLISDLLALSRVGTRGAELVPTDLNVVLSHALADLKMALDDAQATVTHDALPTVAGDGGQLEQVMLNLIGNAVKFRGAEPPRVHVGARRENGSWVLSVRDNGIGIESRYFERIFVIFQRLHGRDAYPGTGLGLAITKRIIERHGGRIWVESELGRSSTFWFTLPAEPGTA